MVRWLPSRLLSDGSAEVDDSASAADLAFSSGGSTGSSFRGCGRGRLPGATSFFKVPTDQAIGCHTLARDVEFHGPWARVSCPAHCERSEGSVAYGASIHPMSSAVCLSAIVDKVMPVFGGELVLTRTPGLASYSAADVGEAASLGLTDDKSEAFHMYASDTIDLPRTLPPVQEANCLTNFKELGLSRPGQSVIVQCPAGCNTVSGDASGSFIYTAESPVCKSAHHAAVLGAAGGKVMVTRGHGQDAYFGSTIGSDASHDAPADEESYMVALPTPAMLMRAKKSAAAVDFLQAQ
eukprot:TRINITY_DN73627_c0_g1_i1.p1 TRINITY_DN73627_c0_g1~~TRINITY_DN73627_c0_g1_i1.p1  ORF type:complete len:294 (+),score=46.19 TRINITY_DN73627_c0_g1_i1:156-1037(+)